MAVQTTLYGTSMLAGMVYDADADGTAENNVRAGATTLYAVDIDNSANGAASFLKLWDALAPVVGTDAPDYIFKIPASSRKQLVFPGGLAFATGLSFACVTAGGTAGTTSPTSNVPVYLSCS